VVKRLVVGRETKRMQAICSTGKLKPILLWAGIVLLPGLAGCASKAHLASPEPLAPQKGAAQEVKEAPEVENPYYNFLRGYMDGMNGETDAAIEAFRKAIAQDPSSSYLHLCLARLYLKRNQPEEALIEAQTVVSLDPNDVDGYSLLAGIYSASNQIEEAIQAYERVLELDPDREKTRLFLSSLHATSGDYDKAVEILQEMIERKPESFIGYYYLGRLYVKQEEFDKAEESFKKALELSNNSEVVLLDLARIYEMQEREEEAIEIYKKILEEDPGNLLVRDRLGQVYISQKKLDEALTHLKALGQMAGSDAIQVHLKIGLVYFEQERFDLAIQEFLIVLAAEPDDYRVGYFLGSAYAENGYFEAAIAAFSRIPPEAEPYVDARLYWAFLLEEEKRLEESVAVIKEALAQKPDDDRLWGFLAALYEHAEDYKEAIRCAQKASEASKAPAKHYFTLGVLYDKQGDLTRSVESMRLVISLEPENAEALNYLGYTYADKGIHLEEAEGLIRKALLIRPEDGYIVDSLGWVYFKQGRYQKALQELQRAEGLIPDDPVILEHLGDAYRKVGTYQKALNAYKRAMEKAKDQDQKKISEKIREIEKLLSNR
jgi:tetratricopeptide (TPR) repeat protein